MPSKWTLNTLPKPNNPNIMLKIVPARTMAVHRYNGGWSKKLYEEELGKLQFELKSHNLRPVAGRPWFMRTNDIMVQIQ
jgi:hypothetical protein